MGGTEKNPENHIRIHEIGILVKRLREAAESLRSWSGTCRAFGPLLGPIQSPSQIYLIPMLFAYLVTAGVPSFVVACCEQEKSVRGKSR